MSLNFGNNQKASLEAYQIQLQKNKDLFTAYDAITKEYCDFKVQQAKDTILGGASSAYDTLKEIETYLGSNDNLSSALLSAIQTTSSNLATEVQRASNAEALLSTRITDEAAARVAAVSAEEVARLAADNVLTASVATERSERLSSDNLITTSINNEVSRATNAETALSLQILDEQKAREASDNSLRADLTTESTERKAEDTRIFNALLQSGQRLGEKDAEILNEVWSIQGQLQMADNALGIRIDTEKARAEASEALKFDKSGGAISGSVSVSGALSLNLSEATNTYLNLSPVWRVVCSNSGDRVQFEFYKDNQWTVALPFIMGV